MADYVNGYIERNNMLMRRAFGDSGNSGDDLLPIFFPPSFVDRLIVQLRVVVRVLSMLRNSLRNNR